MNTTQSNKAGQNHAELVKAAVSNGAQFVADNARNVGTRVQRAYGAAKPVVAEQAQKVGGTVALAAKCTGSYAGGFLRTLFTRSSRVK